MRQSSPARSTGLTGLRVYNPAPYRFNNCLNRLGDAELVASRLKVPLYGPFRQAEDLGGFPRRFAERCPKQDLLFALCQLRCAGLINRCLQGQASINRHGHQLFSRPLRDVASAGRRRKRHDGLPVIGAEHWDREPTANTKLSCLGLDRPRFLGGGKLLWNVTPREGLECVCGEEANPVDSSVIGFDVPFEPACWPTVQFHHRRQFLAPDRHSTEDEMVEPEGVYRRKQIVHQTFRLPMKFTALDEIENSGVYH
jgi:hypothetical protein